MRRVDAERGLIPREAWLRAAIEHALSPAMADMRATGRALAQRKAAAPAEQPRDGVPGPVGDSVAYYRQLAARSSVQAKRDVRPVPKKGEK